MPISTWRTRLLVPFFLSAVLAGCQDLAPPTDPVVPLPQFAQGDGGVYTVNSLLDPGDGTCDETECTLREAVDAASAFDTETRIQFAPGLTGTIALSNTIALGNMFTTLDGDGRITLDAGGAAWVMSVADFAATTGNPTVTVKGLTLTHGQSFQAGAGLLATGPELVLVLDHVVITDNHTDANGGGLGVANGAEVTLRYSTVSGNSALNGGGIGTQLGTKLTVFRSTVAGNTATEDGGGIVGLGEVSITGSTISGNTSLVGAIWTDHILTMRSSTVTGNVSGPGNTAGLRAGASQAVVTNSIIAGNFGKGECGGNVASNGYNLSESGLFAGCDFTTTGDRLVDGSSIFTEVLESELKDNGGPTKTHALLVRGRAVDAGYCPGETEDQRGLTRPVEEPALANARDGCDIGAYELQGPVTPIADLMISQSANKTSVKQGDLLTYRVRVQNLGPQSAPNTVVANTLSSGVAFVSAKAGKGSFTAPPAGETGTVTWTLGDFASQANEVAEIEVTVRIKGRTTITNTASVSADVVDPNGANNTASLAVSVASGTTTTKGGKPN